MQLRNPRDLVRIESHDVYLGSPTRLDIYSAGGQMFLARGATVYRADTVEKLQTEGFKLGQSHGAAKHPQEPVFLRIGDIADKLFKFERALVTGQDVGVFSLKFRALAQELIRCCDQDADAALAQSYLNYHHPYSVLHHILVAVVVSVLTKVFGWSGTDRMSLVAAALTHDLGALPMRHSLGQSAPLDATQKSLVHQHPTTGTQLLTQFGVTDALWLQAVQEHHECVDGSGYPNGIVVGLQSASTLMTVADGFAAMMRPRPYRERILGEAIIRDLRKYVLTRYAPAPIEAIATHIGVYHAGSIVRLANDEMAVVTRHRPDRPLAPDVLVLADARDRPYDKPHPADSTAPEFAITAALAPEVCLRFQTKVNQSWCVPHTSSEFPYQQ